ncbi:ELM1/GtrOC1 family putative glycosyltransferase [Sphingomonas alba]|uniref:Mitochondrial fission ELM1 family protein n=1 Tax=Sphingomonas alba TaxID=2908208 RepID=A0ABT0RK26_9SPHN|nr:ELM1/GtrOC1 family putative glycosyltransferase [Sphingomonas alba]MCL6682992.1 mitochondrial fission ELM1 family protein [Sphingomonas alba]
MDDTRNWVLLYSRTGDNNQALALAKSLGQPFETKELKYNWLRRFGLRLGPTFLTLDRDSRKQLAPPWPPLVIAVGRWSVPVARAIKARSKGRSRVVFLGNPRIDPAHFDLVFATRDYLEPRGPNVVVVPMPLAASTASDVVSADWAVHLPHPRTLLLIGASIKYWELAPARVAETVRSLAEKANAAGGSLLVSGSPRTPDELLLAAGNALRHARHGWIAPSRTSGLAAMFAAADEVVVTGDSMSMVTEAVLTGKPVGLVPLDLNNKGARKIGVVAASEGSGSKRRDMRRFWAELWDKGLAGTALRPKTAAVAASAAAAALIVTAYLATTPIAEAIEQPVSVVAPAFGAISAAVIGLWHGIQSLMDAAQRDAGALWLAAWEPQTPWYVKLIAGLTSASAISPIDLTPDVIPVIGYMDDLFLLAIGMFLTARLIPKPLMAELRERAVSVDFTMARRGAATIACIWLAAAAAALVRGLGLF